MEKWIADLMSHPGYPAGNSWESRRRWLIITRWPDASVRAAEQDARLGKTDALTQYDSEVALIKIAVPKP